MPNEAAATPPKPLETAEPLANLQQVLWWLTRVRDYVILELLDVLEPRRT